MGLAFKPRTDDVRESPAIKIVEHLLREGARVRAYDPRATENFSKLFPHLEYTSPEKILESDAIQSGQNSKSWTTRGGSFWTAGGIETAKKAAKICEGVCW